MAHSSELSPAMVSRGSARWVDASPVPPPLSAPGRSGVGNKHMDGSAPDGRARPSRAGRPSRPATALAAQPQLPGEKSGTLRS